MQATCHARTPVAATSSTVIDRISTLLIRPKPAVHQGLVRDNIPKILHHIYLAGEHRLMPSCMLSASIIHVLHGDLDNINSPDWHSTSPSKVQLGNSSMHGQAMEILTGSMPKISGCTPPLEQLHRDVEVAKLIHHHATLPGGLWRLPH